MSRVTPHAPITTRLAVEALQDAVREYAEYEAQKAEKLAHRDAQIRSAAEYIPQLRLVKLTGLTRQQIYRIIGQPDKE